MVTKPSSTTHSDVSDSNVSTESLVTTETEVETADASVRSTRRSCNCFPPGKTSFWRQFFYLSTLTISIGYDQQVMSLALPQLAQTFGVTSSQVQWIISIFYIANAATSVLHGHLGMYFGPSRYSLVMSVLKLLTYIASVFVPNLGWIFFIRAITGVGASGCVASKNSLMKTLSPPEKLHKYLMYNIIQFNVFAIFIPVVGGFITSFFGWKSIFLVCAVLEALNVIALAMIPNPVRNKTHFRMDYGGTILLTLDVTAFCLAFSFFAQLEYLLSSLLFIITIVLTIGFYFLERRLTYPILPFQALRNPVGAYYIAYILQNVLLAGITILMPFIYTHRYHMTGSGIGIINGLSALVRTFVAAITPLLDKKCVRRFLIGYGFVISSIFCIVSALAMDTNAWVVVTMQVLITMFQCVPATLLFPMAVTGNPKYSSLMSGLPTMCRTMGSSVGDSLFTAIQTFILLTDYGAAFGVTDADPYYVKAYVRGCSISFWILGLLSAFTGIYSILRVRNTPVERGKCGFKESQVPPSWDELEAFVRKAVKEKSIDDALEKNNVEDETEEERKEPSG